MPRIELVTRIVAPIERCFDLARSIDLHMTSTTGTEEQAVAGVTSGLIGMGEEVTWRARHLGVVQHLTSRITAYDRPHHFTDTMQRGAFARMRHDHLFTTDGDVTLMTDILDFASPFGIIGRIVDRLFLEGYMRRFLIERNRIIRETAESEAWREVLNGEF